MKALEKKIEEIRINAANRESVLTGENSRFRVGKETIRRIMS